MLPKPFPGFNEFISCLQRAPGQLLNKKFPRNMNSFQNSFMSGKLEKEKENVLQTIGNK